LIGAPRASDTIHAVKRRALKLLLFLLLGAVINIIVADHF
jgi:hypothetical protein